MATFLDPVSAGQFDVIGVGAGWRCLTIGAGTGTAVDVLTARVGSAGEVVALDIDASFLRPRRGLSVIRHDVRTPDRWPVNGLFDVIDARLITQQVPHPGDVVERAADLLAPGGWLVTSEYVDRPRTIAAGDPADIDVLERLLRELGHVSGTDGGGSDVDTHRFLEDNGFMLTPAADIAVAARQLRNDTSCQLQSYRVATSRAHF